MKKDKKLTVKQREFINEYVENGENGTKAALKVYDVGSTANAAKIASQNLTKEHIREEMIQRLTLSEDVAERTLGTGLAIAIKQANEVIQNIDSTEAAVAKARTFLLDCHKMLKKEEKAPTIDNSGPIKVPTRR